MDKEPFYAGIAAILASGISFLIPDTSLPKRIQAAQERIARLWGITPKQAIIVECTGAALLGILFIIISIFTSRNAP
jgi:hypothetical protein